MRKFAAEYGSIAATVLGLIGLIWSFHLTTAIAVIVSLVVVILGITMLAVRYIQSRRPEFTIFNIEKTLVLHDRSGHLATLVRKSTEVANTKGLREIWFRNIGADGEIENITIDNEPAIEAVNVFHQLNLTHIRKSFPEPTEKGQEIETIISYDMIGSFVKTSEALIHVVNYKTKKIRMIVRFPNERPFKSAELTEIYGGAKPQVIIRIMPAENANLEVEFEDLKLGANYELRWEW